MTTSEKQDRIDYIVSRLDLEGCLDTSKFNEISRCILVFHDMYLCQI